MRLTLDEPEWLWRELKEQAKQTRHQAGEEGFGLADYQHAWGLTPRNGESQAGSEGELRGIRTREGRRIPLLQSWVNKRLRQKLATIHTWQVSE
jgi:hypothetical protein